MVKVTKGLTFGVGINDADYQLKIQKELPKLDGKRRRKLLWVCPYFSRWVNMLQRCYSRSFQKSRQTYIGCTVCDEWLTFSNFKAWMEKQDWEGKELDKDLLVDGNKVYSPDTCVFISQSLNKFFSYRGKANGLLPIGVSIHKASGKYQAKCCNPITNVREHLGYWDNFEEAHEAWVNRKNKIAIMLSELQTDKRLKEVLLKKYSQASMVT
jgi:hypothetical protein